MNFAVHPQARRQGLASLLLDFLFEYARERGVDQIQLEVRPSNPAALSLYGRNGFHEVGRRPNYYAEDHEDAILMTRVINPAPALKKDIDSACSK